MTPEQAQSIAVVIGAIVGAVTGIGALVIAIWAAWRGARKDELDELSAIIKTQGETITELRTELRKVEEKNEKLQTENDGLRRRVAYLETLSPRRNTGPLGE